MRSLGLQEFGEFYDFLKRGDNLIDDGITWRKLKLMIAESTSNTRLKKFIMNRTQKQFNEILMDGSQFDRLLNGRWISKPSLTRRGRMSYGRRSNECVDGFKKSFIPLFNYIIQNNIDVYEDSKEYVYKKFTQQDSIIYFIRWYTTLELKFDSVPKREIDVTKKLLNSFVEIMEETKIDFRKLNSEYIISSISNKIKSSMIVTPGTMLKCLKDVPFGVKTSLIANNSYQVKSSRLDMNGYLQVYVIDELNRDVSYPYSYFEDMAFHRDDLLSSLFG
jgi:hypothetical protein